MIMRLCWAHKELIDILVSKCGVSVVDAFGRFLCLCIAKRNWEGRKAEGGGGGGSSGLWWDVVAHAIRYARQSRYQVYS